MPRIRASRLVALTTCLALAAPGCELDEYLAGLEPDAGFADDAGPITPDQPDQPDKPGAAGKPGRPPKPSAGRPAPIVRDAGPAPYEPDSGAAHGGVAYAPDTFGVTSRGRSRTDRRAALHLTGVAW